jgi:hypothetical protein
MSDKVLVLRVCHEGGWSDGQSGRPRFQWPLTEGAAAAVEAKDWNPEPVCGYGLHGWLWGAGDVGLAGAEWAFTEAAPVWMVLEVERDLVVPLEGGVKVKFPRCVVRKFGSLQECAAEISSQAPAGTAVIGHTATAGYAGTATAGYAGTATAGDAGTATAGDAGTATAGERGTATAGERGTATAGERGTATAGERGTATVGYAGTATAGDDGTATAGDDGTATAGYAGTATAGDAGTATAGYGGTATAGDAGLIEIRWWDEKACGGRGRHRVAIGYVGEGGIEAGEYYKVKVENGQAQLVLADPQPVVKK